MICILVEPFCLCRTQFLVLHGLGSNRIFDCCTLLRCCSDSWKLPANDLHMLAYLGTMYEDVIRHLSLTLTFW